MVEELGEFGSQDWRTSSGTSHMSHTMQIHPIHNFELKDRATERRAIPANDSGDDNSDEDMSNNTNSKDNNFRGIASADQENLNLLGENQFLETSLLKCFNSFKIMQLGTVFFLTGYPFKVSCILNLSSQEYRNTGTEWKYSSSGAGNVFAP